MPIQKQFHLDFPVFSILTAHWNHLGSFINLMPASHPEFLIDLSAGWMLLFCLYACLFVFNSLGDASVLSRLKSIGLDACGLQVKAPNLDHELQGCPFNLAQ